MSYILDALRKSDLQRQHGTAPTLQTTPLRAHARAHPHAWIYGVLGLLLVAAGIAIGWLRPWQGQPASLEERAIAQPEARRTIAPPVPLEAVVAPEPPARTPADSAPRPAAVPGPAVRKEPPKPAAASPAPPVATSSEAKVLSIGELPQAIQQEIPPISVTVHAYSQRAADRMAGINNSIVREGATVAPGLKLDEITPEGLVFSYKGYRFRRGVQN